MPSAGGAPATVAWCHQCSRVVRVRPGDAVICPDCDTGFVELVQTPLTRNFPSAGGGSGRRYGRAPITAMYMVDRPSTSGLRRSRWSATGSRSPFNPVVVLRGPSDGGGGEDGSVGRAAAATFELYYDGGPGSGLRPLPAIMSEFLVGSGLHRLLEQLAQMETNTAAVTGPLQLPASKAAMEAMPTVEIAESHVRLDAHCAICTDPFELGAKAREMPCKHIFHQDCIVPWLTLRNSCPVCRHEMPPDSHSGSGELEPHGDQGAAAGDGEEGTLGLTIWRLPGGGFAVGRFSGGRRAGGREFPVVYTEVDGGLNTNGTPRRISGTSRGTRSRGNGGVGGAFRNFFSFFGRLFGSSSTSSSPVRSSESGSSSRRSSASSVLGRSPRGHGHS